MSILAASFPVRSWRLAESYYHRMWPDWLLQNPQLKPDRSSGGTIRARAPRHVSLTKPNPTCRHFRHKTTSKHAARAPAASENTHLPAVYAQQSSCGDKPETMRSRTEPIRSVTRVNASSRVRMRGMRCKQTTWLELDSLQQKADETVCVAQVRKHLCGQTDPKCKSGLFLVQRCFTQLDLKSQAI